MARSDMYRKLPWTGGDARSVAEIVNNLVEGKSNNTGEITLVASGAVSTTINDERIGSNSYIGLEPISQTAASTYFPYGAFQDTTDQSIATTTATANITLNTTSGNAFSGATTCTITGTPVINVVGTDTDTRFISATTVTESNSISFNITAGTQTITISGYVKSLNFTGFAGSLSSSTRRLFGSLTISTGMTVVAGASTTTFAATSGIQTITSNSKTLDISIQIRGAGGTFRLTDNLTLGSLKSLTLSNGTFDANNQNVTVGLFSNSNSGTRTLTMGSGTWTLIGTATVWNSAITTGLTFNKDTANIVLSDTTTTARTFAGGGLTYNKLTIGGATGISTLTITGANTFSELASTKTVAHTISFGANQTITTWSVTGTSGNVVTVNSSSQRTARTLTITNRTSGIDYLDVLDITAPLAPVTILSAKLASGVPFAMLAKLGAA